MSFKLTAEERQLKEASILLEAKHQASYETEQFISLVRFCHHLSCQNTNNQLKKSNTGGIVIPHAMLTQMALGFAKDNRQREVFCVFFQPYLWNMIKSVPLEGMVLDRSSQSVLIRFKETTIGDYKIPKMDLSLDICSKTIWEKLISGTVKRSALAGIEKNLDNPSCFYCTEIQSEPAMLLQDFFGVRSHHALF